MGNNHHMILCRFAHCSWSMSIFGFSGWFATGIGREYLPLLSGTLGALIGAFLAVGLGRLSPKMRIVVVAALIALTIPICEYMSRSFGGSDNPLIIADEIFTFPLATIALPVRHHPALIVVALICNRVFDIFKPPPARAAEQLGGGFGIVLDDVVANSWTLLLGVIGWRLWCNRR
jgi:phosphatidylglycerophosphatase A